MTEIRNVLWLGDNQVFGDAIRDQFIDHKVVNLTVDSSHKELADCREDNTPDSRWHLLIAECGHDSDKLVDLVGKFNCPIIILAAPKQAEDLAKSVSDKDNCQIIPRPIKFRQLIATILDTINFADNNINYVIGSLRFWPAEKKIVAEDQNLQIKLTETESNLLNYLCRAKGQVVSRNELLQQVLGYNNSEINTHSLESHIYRLRQKICSLLTNATSKNNDPRPELIVSNNGGYQIID